MVLSTTGFGYGSEITIEQMRPGAPAWWLHRLVGQLLVDRPRMVLMDRYYRGNHPIPRMPRELESEYKRMLVQSRSNFMSVVVEAPAERLNVQGFRSRGAEDADDAAWEWWLDNGMDVDANLVITNALAMGRGYLAVEKDSDADEPRVQIIDPRMAMVEMDPSNRQRRAAGLRLWHDDWTGNVMADVWIDGDACYHFAAKAERVLRSTLWPQSWEPAFPIDDRIVRLTDLELREEPAATLGQWCTGWLALDFDTSSRGEVPLVPLVNRPSTLKRPDGESEIDDVYLTQDRINEMLFNRSLAAFTAAFQQKWATGIDIPTDETGKAIQPFKAAVDRLWADTSPDAAFGAFPATDLKNYIAAIEEDVQHIAVQTRTPRHYFLQQGQSPSGDAIKSAEAGLVAKVNEKQRIYGRSFAEVIRLRNVLGGNEGAKPVEVIWADPEFRTLAELSDAVIKQHQVGLLPIRSAREKLQYSPSEIDRMEQLDEQEALVRDTQAALEAPETRALPPGAPLVAEEEPAAEESAPPVRG